MLRPQLLRDPYSVGKRLRVESPVCRLESGGPWLIARHADVLSVLKDPGLFRSGRAVTRPVTMNPEFLLKTRGLVGADPPEHARLRAQIKEAFTPSRIRSLEEQIRGLVRAKFRALVPRGEFEVVGELARPLPMEVITMLMGVPLEQAGDFARWADVLVTWGSPDCSFSAEEVSKNAEEMHDYFSRAIVSGKNGAGLIGTLARKLDDKEKMQAPSELLAFLRLLIVAGSETTTHLISNTVLALLSQPGLWQAVQNEHGRIPDLIEESLRYDSPVPSLIRWATTDTSIAGITIRKDEAVMPLLASANHDELVFEEPERFALDRPVRPHLSFGAGPHYCLGVGLARLQVRVVFEEILNAISEIALVNSGPIVRTESFFVRGPVRLWVTCK